MKKGFLNPNEILGQIQIRKDMVAAEFGSGSGLFSILLAKKLERGKVYAIDIQEAPISALKSRASLENVLNIQIIRSDLEKPNGSTLPDDFLDLVLIPNLLFQVGNKNAILLEANRVLKREGVLVVIDWLPEASQGPEKGRISPQEVKKIVKEMGLKVRKEFKAGVYHWGLIFEKP